MESVIDSVIDIRGLGLTFERDGRRTEVLRELDLAIPRGGFVAIVGASGVGKSTLLRVLTGLAKAGAGKVSVSTRSTARQPVTLVFQDSRLLPWRRVVDNVAFGLEGTGLSKAERRAKAIEALRLVGLADLAGRWPYQLSGGQRQRVSLARALAVEPEVLLMDEPFSALDAISREGLQDELTRIWRQTGKTILFVTHDIEEAAYLADRVVVLAGSPGRTVIDRTIGTPRPRRRDEPGNAALIADIRRHLGKTA
jgi:NitT/TauT family transport system ATP-binding protein